MATLSVVIAWVNPRPLLEPVLEALRRQQPRPPDEIVIASRHDERTLSALRAAQPDLTILAAPRTTPLPQLRSLALRQARGSIVAVLEDHCVPTTRWLHAIEERMATGCDSVAGPVENACGERWRDWAAFLTEYAGALPPLLDAGATALPSNNMAYRRELLANLCAVLERGRWESFYYAALAARGVVIACDPAMLVYHRQPFDSWYFLRQRYHSGRAFAGMRGHDFTLAQRIVYALGSIVLPPLLIMRGLRTVVRKRRLVGRYLGCVPLIGVYVTAGAVGEIIGYLFGGGHSLEHVQ